MSPKIIELKILQLEEIFSKSKNNSYSDKRKDVHFNEIYTLFEAIKKSDFKSLKESDLKNFNIILGFISKYLQFLDNSTLNIIPYEFVSCLELALSDWVDVDNIIIVTSLSNKSNEYLFEYETIEDFILLNRYIKDNFNLTITHRFLKIVLPKSLSKEYLPNVVLYHELGHFVDIELNVSEKIIDRKYNGVKNYEINMEKNHLMEYFADLFASQYVHDSSNVYLKHIAHDDKDSYTHPSTQKRIDVVDDFLISGTSEYIRMFNEVLISIYKPMFKFRFEILNTEGDGFRDLVPFDVSNNEELHSLFKLGWDLWNNSENNFLKDFDIKTQYIILNNLIEKSISIYIIKQKWRA